VHDSASRDLALTAKAVRRVFEGRLAEAGASLPTWIVLNHTRDNSDRSQRELAALMAIEGPTLTRHLDRMEAEGLIERRPYPSDRRRFRVAITAAGRHLHTRLRRLATETEADLFAGVGARDVAVFRRVLARVRANCDEESDAATA
jgi:MarR family transcriptional regulator for hemolysin